MNDQTTNEREDEQGADRQERRKTVIVTCSVPNGVQIRRHTPGLDDRAPMMPSGHGYELKQGDTEGVDKEWFDGWLEENKNLSLVTNGQISWRDTPEPTEDELRAEQEQRDREERDRKHNEEEQQKLIDNAGASNAGAEPVMGIQDGPGNPERNQPPEQPKASTDQQSNPGV
jgi:hypothetical protein